MQYNLAYGRGQLTVELPEENVAKVLNIHSAPAVEDPMDAVFDVLEDPIEAEPLAAIAEGKKSACVVICDITRPVPNDLVLPPILQTLEDAGIDPQKITILIATGLHRSSTPEERVEILGEDLLGRKYKVIDHNAKKLHQHEYLGVTKSGTPIWIDRRYLEADVKVLTGLIEPHFMAGFSGGRKLICPGIAAAETICPWHSPKLLEHENARYGCLEGNPVHSEQMEIARKAGCDFIVNVVLNQERKIVAVVGGEMNRAHLKGVAIARKLAVDMVEKPADIVVTSGAGYPLDKTWYQTIKGIVGAAEILKPGGTIVIASECSEGVGSKEFEEIAGKFPSLDEFMEAITTEEFFSVDQWQVEELAKALRRGKVKVVTQGVLPEVLQQYFVEPAETVEEAVKEAMKKYGAEAKIVVIPDGPYVLAELPESEKEIIRKETVRKEPVKKELVKKETVKKEAAAEKEVITKQPKKKEGVKTEAAEKEPVKKATAKKAAVKKEPVKKKTVKKETAKKETKKAVKKKAAKGA
ncbi:MAG: nickel-dependent lactate racemase [Planctomycetaceae bacterium]|jgi:nickel-dependent lactate racemase|nr:nickel-dependent lactate racemase [Planctomycetaceae bacterium]